MTPRHAVLTVAPLEVLEDLARAAQVPVPPGSGRDRLAGALFRAPELDTHAMLRALDAPQLREVAGACGLLQSGDREALLERLARRAGFEPAPGARAPRKRAARRSKRPSTRRPWVYRPDETFVALDFETADPGRDSACQVALVRVEAGQLVETRSTLIRPPRKRFTFTRIHGITWAQVRAERTFAEVWPELSPLLEGADYLVAHNAPFDRGVLEACCEAAGLAPPPQPFRCTVALARARWQLRRARLPDVCRLLDIPLEHHDATSDAQACARIVIASAEPVAGSPGGPVR